MSKVYPGMHHLYGNVLAVVDLETSGRRAGYHEIIQIAVVPLNEDIRPMEEVRPFYTTVAPLHPERADKRSTKVHGLCIEDLVAHAPHPDRVQDMLLEWYAKLDLPVGKCLVPLAHNWAFEASFLKAWLGVDLTSELFHSNARDSMLYALSINDRATFEGEHPPFKRVNLDALCKKFNVANTHAHDALADSIAEAEVYRAMLTTNLY
ncbi:MAG: 3'-5' exonuclease [Fimbriimonadaceae bacterium]|nr:3'-5' exonuclease [Fimbriimonadaceae bacterium]